MGGGDDDEARLARQREIMDRVAVTRLPPTGDDEVDPMIPATLAAMQRNGDEWTSRPRFEAVESEDGTDWMIFNEEGGTASPEKFASKEEADAQIAAFNAVYDEPQPPVGSSEYDRLMRLTDMAVEFVASYEGDGDGDAAAEWAYTRADALDLSEEDDAQLKVMIDEQAAELDEMDEGVEPNDVQRYIDDVVTELPEDLDFDSPEGREQFYNAVRAKLDGELAAGHISDAEYEAYLGEVERDAAGLDEPLSPAGEAAPTGGDLRYWAGKVGSASVMLEVGGGDRKPARTDLVRANELLEDVYDELAEGDALKAELGEALDELQRLQISGGRAPASEYADLSEELQRIGISLDGSAMRTDEKTLPAWAAVLDTAFVSDGLEAKAGGADRNRGGAGKLRRYWTHGAGAAKIRWGTPGDFMRCVHQLEKYLGPRAKGYCNLRHQEAVGGPPGQGAHGGKTLLLDTEDGDTLVAELEAKLARTLETGRADRLKLAVKDLHAALQEALDEVGADTDLDELLAAHDALRAGLTDPS
jgi:hypothetical protein